MDRQRGSLVSKCHRCGTSLWLASAEQHGALQAVLEDLSVGLIWPAPSLQAQFPRSKPAFRGPRWWWQMIVQSFDRLKEGELEQAPALDGQGFDGRGLDFVRGARLRRTVNSVEISEIIEYSRAFAIEHGVKLREFEKKAA